jgi:hypothetical protein
MADKLEIVYYDIVEKARSEKVTQIPPDSYVRFRNGESVIDVHFLKDGSLDIRCFQPMTLYPEASNHIRISMENYT